MSERGTTWSSEFTQRRVSLQLPAVFHSVLKLCREMDRIRSDIGRNRDRLSLYTPRTGLLHEYRSADAEALMLEIQILNVMLVAAIVIYVMFTGH